MSVELLPIACYTVWLGSSAISVVVARRSGTLFISDLALLIAPPLAFVIALVVFNEPALTGWAFLLYPLLIAALSVGLLHARVFVLCRMGVSAQTVSRILLGAAIVGSALLGTFVPPLYE